MSIVKRTHGTQGKSVTVVTNSFEITRLPTKSYYMYDVVFTPEPRHERQKQEILDRLQNHTAPQVFTPKAVYDGKAILFASHQLQLSGGGTGQFAVCMSDRPPLPGSVAQRGVYNVKLSRAAAQTIDFSALNDFISQRAISSSRTLTAINLLQLLIRAAPNLMYPHNLRAYYTDAGMERIGGGLELWRGFFQSVRPTIGRMLVNVDVSIAAMYEAGPLQEIALRALGSRNARDLEFDQNHVNYRKLKSFFKNVKVLVNPTGAIQNPSQNAKGPKKVIRDLVPYAGDYKFFKNGEETTVRKHFQEAHLYQLKFPRIFGIRVGSKERDIVFPAEVCSVISGQLYKKKVPQELTPKVVKFATRRPKERLQTIEQGHGNQMAPVLAYQSSPFLQDAGMQVASSPIRINGRILPTPTLFFGGNQALNINEGAWNIMQNRFRTPKPITAWAVVIYAHSNAHGAEQKAEEFIQMMKRCFSNLGMKCHLPPYMARANDQGDYLKELRNIAASTRDHATNQAMQMPPNNRPPKPPNVQLIIAILPFPATDIRRAIKRFGDVEEGIPTQCVRMDKISSKSGNSLNQYCNNVALKINARLGGENFIANSRALAELQKARFMIIGADVGHPGIGVPTQPSVASLVWSYDANAVNYAAFSSVQEPRQEHIEELESMMKRALEAFGEITKGPPERIVLFRDGLSEGEFEGVGTKEIEAIQAAIDQVWTTRGLAANSKPKLTYIIVGKRHHVRFFPSDPDGADAKSGNCKSGFVADNGLDSPIAADWYLQSHGGLLGTSRPSHYTILRDDIFGKHPDALQQLAFTLCHCYAKATRSVSIPAPVYYADLVCARAKFHFDSDLGYEDTLTSSSDDKSFNLGPWKAGYRPLHGGLKRSMYFL